MNKIFHEILVIEYKNRASILLKRIRSHNQREIALNRVELSGIKRVSDGLKLKDTLHVIAFEHGFDSWDAFKSNVQDPFNNKLCGGFLNKWFNKYKDALQHLEKEAGYLLPYRKQFVICSKNYLFALGMDGNSQMWSKICNNFVYPTDHKALISIYEEFLSSRNGKNV